MRLYTTVCSVLLALLASAGLTATFVDAAPDTVTEEEAASLTGAAEQPLYWLTMNAGCYGVCSRNPTVACVSTNSWAASTAGIHGTRDPSIRCSNCGGNCSVIFPGFKAE
jgi:hypothetical protein